MAPSKEELKIALTALSLGDNGDDNTINNDIQNALSICLLEEEDIFTNKNDSDSKPLYESNEDSTETTDELLRIAYEKDTITKQIS